VKNKLLHKLTRPLASAIPESMVKGILRKVYRVLNSNKFSSGDESNYGAFSKVHSITCEEAVSLSRFGVDTKYWWSPNE